MPSRLSASSRSRTPLARSTSVSATCEVARGWVPRPCGYRPFSRCKLTAPLKSEVLSALLVFPVDDVYRSRGPVSAECEPERVVRRRGAVPWARGGAARPAGRAKNYGVPGFTTGSGRRAGGSPRVRPPRRRRAAAAIMPRTSEVRGGRRAPEAATAPRPLPFQALRGVRSPERARTRTRPTHNGLLATTPRHSTWA
jgi:hypothetical protein